MECQATFFLLLNSLLSIVILLKTNEYKENKASRDKYGNKVIAMVVK